MKTTKIAVAAMAALCAVSLVSSCRKAGKGAEPVAEQETEFTVTLNAVEAEYAEVVVRHTGAKDAKWFGFVTDDVTTAEQDLIKAQVSQMDKKALHVGNAQTVAVRNLTEKSNYRYVAFAVNEAGESYGKPGSVTFNTSPQLKVTFNAEATEVGFNQATFTVSHAGNEVLTYTCFVTTDLTTDAATMAQSDYAACVTDGKLNEGVTLLSGTSQTVTIDELDDETKYRFIVYGIYDNNGTYVYYGTPADCAFETPIDLSSVKFSAETSNVTGTSADVAVSYDAKAEDLTWYGFLTDDVTSEASALITAKVAGITSADYQTGAQKVSLTELTRGTEYRYIVTGINADGVYGIPADVKFTAEDKELVLAYSDFIGEWKLDGTVFTVSAKEEGSTYTIEGFPGAALARGSVKTIVATYDSAKGVLAVEDQDMGEYEDPSSNGYGTLKDFFAGAKMETMSDKSQQYWPSYPFESDEKKPIFTFVGMKDGTYELRPVGDVEATIGGWVILAGTYAGKGNTYGGTVELPAAVTKVDKVAAKYEDFLGKWQFGTDVITIAQKQAGSTYSVTGFSGQESINGDLKVVTANYDAAKKEFYIMEQKLGAFNAADVEGYPAEYGVCDDYLSGYFPYEDTGYFDYPFNTNDPARIFTAYINGAGQMEIIVGSCSLGTFSSLDFIWVIRSGEDAGKGNNYSYPGNGVTIPTGMTKTSSTTSIPSHATKANTSLGASRAPKTSFQSIAK